MAPSLPSDQGLSIQCVQQCFLMLILMLTHTLGMMCCLLMWVWTYYGWVVSSQQSALKITNPSGNEPRLILF